MSSSHLLPFASDYMEGAHPAILKRLAETNRTPMPGYGTDAISEAARAKIRAACQCPDADVYFLVGGTQTNATVIDALLAVAEEAMERAREDGGNDVRYDVRDDLPINE